MNRKVLLILFICSTLFSKDISLNLINADIKDAFRILGELENLNMVFDSNVKGEITVSLKNVKFEDAFKIILDLNNLECEKIENIYYIKPKEKPKKEIKIFKLKFISAKDIKNILIPFLSPDGKIEILTETIVGGWETSGISSGVSSESSKTLGQKSKKPPLLEERPSILLIQDLPENLLLIENLIKNLDIPKNKVEIEVTFVEIAEDKIKVLGINWEYIDSSYENEGGIKIESQTGDIIPPSSGFSGFKISYSDLEGSQLIATIQALQQEKKAKIISNPKLIVVEEHTANILVGEKYPVLKTEIAGTNPPIPIESFSHYEPVGVSLFLTPKVIPPDTINLIIHPEVSSLGDEVVGSTGLKIRRINTREVDTVVNLKDGNIVVIGGLLSKEKQTLISKTPILGDIPLLGKLFQRENKEYIDMELIIFIKAKIIKEEISEEKTLEKMSGF